MSISVQQLKRILGSFSQTVAKDVSGIKTTYATKKDVEGFAKVSDLNNVYIKKGDIHTEDFVLAATFRDAYNNRLVKKEDIPATDTIATKQEISDAVAAIQVPSIEGLAKVTDVYTKLAAKADVTAIPDISNLATKEEVSAVDTKLATKADASAIPSIDGLAKTSEVEATYAKKSEVPSIEGLATKAEVTEAVTGLAKASEVAETYATKEAVNAVAGLDSETVNTLKSLAQNADLTTVAEKVKNVYTKAETDDKLATKADISAIPDVSGLATKAEVAAIDAKFATKADVSAIPSIEGLAKTTDIEAAYAKKTELPDVSGLATKAEVEALKTDFVTEETLTQNINQFSTNVDGKINEAKGELEAKVTAVDTKLSDYAKKTELPSVEGLAKATEIESTYAKKTELPDVSRLVTKTELSDATVNLATKSEVGVIKGRLTEFLPKSGAASLFAQKAELNDYLRKDDVSDVSVTKAAYDAKVQELESEISTLKAKLAAVASGTTEQRPTENLVVGQQYFDTTLGVPVYWNGTEWHNPFANITTVEVENH